MDSKHKRVFSRLQGDRGELDNRWELLAELFHPQRVGFHSDGPVQGKARRLYDTEPVRYMTELATSMESMLMPRAENWCDLSTQNIAIQDDWAAQTWMQSTQETMFRHIYRPKSGFLTATSQIFPDIVTFGTGTILRGTDRTGRFLTFRCIHPKNVFWQFDDNFTIYSHYVRHWMTVEAMKLRYKNLHPDRERQLDHDPMGMVEILHVVEPRELTRGRGSADDLPFASVVYDIRYDWVLSKSGYRADPYITAFWHVLDRYDLWSPAFLASSSSAVLQQMGKTLLKGGQRAVDPPIVYPSDGIANLELIPGGASSYDPTVLGARRQIVEKIDIAGNIPIGREMQADYRDMIASVFWAKVLSLPEKYMSATEVLRYNEDLQRIIQSPFGRLENTLSGPIMDAVFDFLMQESIDRDFNPQLGAPLAEPPEELKGATLTYEFNSPVARARQIAQLARFAQVWGMLSPIFAVDRTAIDNFNFDKIVRSAARAGVGFPAEFLRPLEEVQALREERQNMEGAAQEASVLDVGSRAARNIAAAGVDLASGAV